MTPNQSIHARKGPLPKFDRQAVLDMIKLKGPMDTETVRERMAEVGWTKEQTDIAIRYLRKTEAIRRVTSNHKYSPVWGVSQ